ncbi:MAG TPA: hypothetical protein VK665_16400 [Candidatus Elarobacter sp.]|nr:hypothetical protein [Candidatus Elarobacter sp.]
MLRLARIAAFAGALSLFTGQAGMPQTSADVRIGFGVRDGVLHLDVFSGVPFTVDPAALHFTLRPYRGFAVDETARAIPVRAVPSAPVLSGVPLRPSYDIPVSIASPPGWGMYQLSAETDPGFARTGDGNPLPVTQFPEAGIGAIAAWWPDERGGDPRLRATQARFTGRVAHAYGEAVRTCDQPHASWGTGYPARTPLHVEAVSRERGRVALLSVGSGTGDYAFRFLAFDPLAFRIAGPEAVPPASQPCPFVLRYADPWHVDTALGLAAPPAFGTQPGFAVRAGMSRDDVVWLVGYPGRYGTVASFRAEDRWTYPAPAPFSWWVRFKKDRVVEVRPPGDLP